jgi:hypothetical protein
MVTSQKQEPLNFFVTFCLVFWFFKDDAILFKTA